MCDGGGSLSLNDPSRDPHVKIGLGGGTNNFVELMALKMLIIFSLEKVF